MSNAIRAVKTEALIEQTMAADQGAAFRGFLKLVLPHMEDAYRTETEGFRSHMGASGVGDPCGRAVWYSFRWATAPHFSGRMQRLFNRGHIEEARFIASLLMIGVQIWQQDENGHQFRISGAEGHYGGSGDGIGIGIPDLPPFTRFLCEFKTHNDKSYKLLLKDGVRISKPEHYIQMQQYMRKMGLTVGLYGATNKNDDDYYYELIPLDTECADQYIERAEKIVWAENAPSRIGNPPSAGNWACKFCDHKPVCFLKAKPAVNCRTCQYSKPAEDKQWFCRLHNQTIPKEIQYTGCAQWSKHPDIGA